MKSQWIQAKFNLWKPQWTADPPTVDKTSHNGHRRVMISDPTQGTMWIVIGEVDKGKKKSLRRKREEFLERCGPVDQQRDSLPAAPCSAPRAPHRPSIMLLSSFLIVTVSHFLLSSYLPQASAQKPSSRVSAYLGVCWVTLFTFTLLQRVSYKYNYTWRAFYKTKGVFHLKRISRQGPRRSTMRGLDAIMRPTRKWNDWFSAAALSNARSALSAVLFLDPTFTGLLPHLQNLGLIYFAQKSILEFDPETFIFTPNVSLTSNQFSSLPAEPKSSRTQLVHFGQM